MATVHDEYPGLFKALDESPHYTLDLETTGFNARLNAITHIGIAIDGESWVVETLGDEYNETIEAFRPYLEDPDKMMIGWNLRFDLQFFLQHKIYCRNRIADGFSALKLLDESNKPKGYHGLKGTTMRMFGYRMQSYEEAKSLFGDFEDYAGDDVIWNEKCLLGGNHDVTGEPVVGLLQQIKDNGFEKLFFLEGRISALVAEMENWGLLIDAEHVLKLSKEYNKKIIDKEAEIKKIAEAPQLNILSPKQMSYILYEKLGIPTEGIKETNTGYSSDKKSIEHLAETIDHPILDAILEYRKYTTLFTRYTEPILTSLIEADGRIHPNFNQLGTSSGRFSSSKPNAQNWPARPWDGLRKAYVAPEECCVFQADYSQVELRLAAYWTSDPNLLKAYQGEEIDVHTLTATNLGVVRKVAKIINFGLLYGMGASKLQVELRSAGINKTIEECQEYRRKFYKTYKNFNKYYDWILQRLKEDGFVSTFTGRRRRVSEEQQRLLRSFDKVHRECLNHPIQGSAGDIMKIAMANLHDEICERRKQDPDGPWSRVMINCMVHDEIVGEVPLSIAQEFKELIRDKMENAVVLKANNGKRVNLIADVCLVRNWGESKLDADERLKLYQDEGMPVEDQKFWVPELAA